MTTYVTTNKRGEEIHRGAWFFAPGETLAVSVGLTEYDETYWRAAGNHADAICRVFPNYLNRQHLETPPLVGDRAKRDPGVSAWRSPSDHITLPEWVAVARTLGSRMCHHDQTNLMRYLAIPGDELIDYFKARQVELKLAFNLEAEERKWMTASVNACQKMLWMSTKVPDAIQPPPVPPLQGWGLTLIRAVKVWRERGDDALEQVLTDYLATERAEQVAAALSR